MVSKSSLAGALVSLGLCLAACSERGAPQPSNTVTVEAPVESRKEVAKWQLLSSGEGTALRFAEGEATPAIHLFCPSRSGQLIVNVPAFKPIASEERLSLGGGGTVVALVANSGGDAMRGGVTGEVPVSAELATILAGPISASYGAQSAGPFTSPADADRAAFLAACGEKTSAPVSPKPVSSVACRMQDGAELTATPLRAIGTEPFWGAGIEGRCITYSTPEDQQGTRIWTRFTPGPDGGIWSGSLDGREFELRTRPAAPPGCSDGMSDNRYPHSVMLRVRGETRRGCAKPA